MTKASEISFELDEEMLNQVAKEFDIKEVVSQFAQAISGKSAKEIEEIGEEIFSSYGIELIRRAWQLGEENPDRTYEVIKEADEATGGELWFPLVPQRALEIAYLGTQDLEYLPVMENNMEKLSYRIDDCKVYLALKEACGEKIAKTLPCAHACLSACQTLFSDLDCTDVEIEMEAATNKDGYCEIAVVKS